MKEAYSDKGVAQPPVVRLDPARLELLTAQDRQRELAAFALRTGDTLQPQYAYVVRPVGSLALGVAAIEPHLGSVRVADLEPSERGVRITWTDDHGPGTATARYQTEQPLVVRMPGREDCQFIRHKIDVAARRNVGLLPAAARLIAAHLHLGSRSALYGFAINGALYDETIFDELEQVNRHQVGFRPWVQALATYCLARTNRDPIVAWRGAAGRVGDKRLPTSKPKPAAHSKATYLHVETVRQLVDAAFDLGVTALVAYRQPSPIAELGRARWHAQRQAIRARGSPAVGHTLPDAATT